MVPLSGSAVISEEGLPPHFTVLLDVETPGIFDGVQFFWCMENCAGSFWVLEYYDFLFELYDNQIIKFFFVNETDALAFKLRFG